MGHMMDPDLAQQGAVGGTVDDVAGAAEADPRHPGSERRAGAGRRILDREAGGRIHAQSPGGRELDAGVRLAAFPAAAARTRLVADKTASVPLALGGRPLLPT